MIFLSFCVYFFDRRRTLERWIFREAIARSLQRFLFTRCDVIAQMCHSIHDIFYILEVETLLTQAFELENMEYFFCCVKKRRNKHLAVLFYLQRVYY